MKYSLKSNVLVGEKVGIIEGIFANAGKYAVRFLNDNVKKVLFEKDLSEMSDTGDEKVDYVKLAARVRTLGAKAGIKKSVLEEYIEGMEDIGEDQAYSNISDADLLKDIKLAAENMNEKKEVIKEAELDKEQPQFIVYKGFKLKIAKSGPSYLARVLNKETDTFRQGATVGYFKTSEDAIKTAKSFVDGMETRLLQVMDEVEELVKAGKTEDEINKNLRSKDVDINKLYKFDSAQKKLVIREAVAPGKPHFAFSGSIEGYIGSKVKNIDQIDSLGITKHTEGADDGSQTDVNYVPVIIAYKGGSVREIPALFATQAEAETAVKKIADDLKLTYSGLKERKLKEYIDEAEIEEIINASQNKVVSEVIYNPDGLYAVTFEDGSKNEYTESDIDALITQLHGKSNYREMGESKVKKENMVEELKLQESLPDHELIEDYLYYDSNFSKDVKKNEEWQSQVESVFQINKVDSFEKLVKKNRTEALGLINFAENISESKINEDRWMVIGYNPKTSKIEVIAMRKSKNVAEPAAKKAKADGYQDIEVVLVSDYEMKEAKKVDVKESKIQEKPQVAIKSILEPIVSEVTKMIEQELDLEKIKNYIVTEVKKHDIKPEDLNKILHGVTAQSNYIKLMTYMHNALLKYEGFGVIKTCESILPEPAEKIILESRLKSLKENYKKDVTELTENFNDQLMVNKELAAQINKQADELEKVTNNLVALNKELGEAKQIIEKYNTQLVESKQIDDLNKQQIASFLSEKLRLDEEIKALKEAHTIELIKKYRDTVLKTRGLTLPSSLQTLFESCNTEAEVDELINTSIKILRESLIHSNKLSEVQLVAEKTSEEINLYGKVASAFKGMQGRK